MFTTYHISSAQDLTTEIINTIKATYKNKAITIIVKEAEDNPILTDDQKSILDERLQEDESTYLSSEESLKQLNKKNGL